MRDRRGSLLQASLLRLVRRRAWSHAALVLRDFGHDETDEILASLGEDAEDIESLLGYAEDTAGGIMAPEYYAPS